MLGQLSWLPLRACVVDEDDDDGEGDALDDAAFATAAPPPTRTPATVRTAKAFRSRDMSDHLLRSCRAPVKSGDLKVP